MYGRDQLGSIWLKTSRLPVISDLAILLIYECIQRERFSVTRTALSQLLYYLLPGLNKLFCLIWENKRMPNPNMYLLL